jgi:hypothetical protein
MVRISGATARDPIRVEDAYRYLRAEHPLEAELAGWTCDAVAAADPDLAPRVYRGWRGIGFRHPDAGYVCGVFPKDGHIELLFEHGATLVDPDGVLRGEGTRTRVLVVERATDATAALIARYVHQAIAQRLLERE